MDLDRIEKLEEWYRDGARWKCLTCGKVYDHKPERFYSGISCEGGTVGECKCGSDLLIPLKEFIKKLKNGEYE